MSLSLRCRLTLVVLAVVLALLLLAPSGASAAFTRPFVRQLAGTPEGFAPEGIAVGAGGVVWVGESERLDEFGSEGSGNTLLQALPIKSYSFPENLAVEQASGRLYFMGNNRVANGEEPVEVYDSSGKLVEQWNDGFTARSGVTVDNTAGLVYVASDGRITRLDPENKPMPFTGFGPCISGDQILGVPENTTSCKHVEFRNSSTITLDSSGDFFVIDAEYEALGPAVLEFNSSGEFVQAFTGVETPGLAGNRENGGFGGTPLGLAFDPVSDHLLVSLDTIRINGGSRTVEAAGVDEFDVGSGRFVDQIRESAPGGDLGEAAEIAVDGSGNLYVVDQTGMRVDVYEQGHFLPSLRIAEASQRTSSTAVLNGLVNPEGFQLSDCHFEYVPQAQFEASGFIGAEKAPCTQSPGSIPPTPATYHPVSAEVKNLQSGKSYRFRLVATSEGELGGTAYGGAVAFTAPARPHILSSSVGNVSSTYADLRATIDPLGAATTYYFQYVDEAEYDAVGFANAQSTPPTAIGAGGTSGSAEESVLQHIGPLLPGTAYRFRVIAANDVGSETGGEGSFASLAEVAPALPDGRAYELVTPANKQGGSDMFATPQTNGEFANADVGVPSQSGNGFLLETFAAFGPFPAAGQSAYVFARDRAAGAWNYTSLASPSLGVQAIASGVVSDPADFSRVAFSAGVGASASTTGERLTSLVGTPGGPYSELHADPATYGASLGTTEIVGASANLEHVILQSQDHSVCPGPEKQAEKLVAGSRVLCEWAGGYETVAGQSVPELRPVDVTFEKRQETLVSRCGAMLGARTRSGGTHDAVSADGSKLFFLAPDPRAEKDGPGCWNGAKVNPPQLYMRSAGKATEISTPQSADEPVAEYPAEYAGASEDGSRVFFLSEGWLTEDHPAVHDLELYEYDTLTGKLTRISAGEAGSPGTNSGAHVFTVPAVSSDGSSVYFTAFDALAPGAGTFSPPTVAQPEASVNLYRHDTVTDTTTHVATISSYDYIENFGCGAQGETILGLEGSSCSLPNWYTTPNGRYLLFASSRELTGYSTVAQAGDCQHLAGKQGEGNGHCEEVYRYDEQIGGLTCVSCDPSKAVPVSNAVFARSAPSDAASAPMRAMSADGSYVFFETADALVPQDTNGTLDVYEWEAQGAGGCTLPEGCVQLVSSGEDSAPSFFLGASEDGSNVFFGTHAKLVREDLDSEGDIYDARICRAEDPCIQAPSGETAQCEGDACQSPQTVALAQAPATLTLASSGNLTGEGGTQPAVTGKAKPSNAQKLAAALKACEKKAKSKRAKCKVQARRRYGAKAKRSIRARHAGRAGQ